MEIDVGTTDDAETVVEMWVGLAGQQRQYGSHVLPEANRTAISEEITRHAVSERLLVARDPDIVGFAMIALDHGRYDMAVTQGVIENLYVVPERRNEGIGSRLLAAAEARLREDGAEAVVLEAMADNLDARRFYRRHGFDSYRVQLEKSLENDNDSR